MPFRYLLTAIRCDVWFTARRSQEPVLLTLRTGM